MRAGVPGGMGADGCGVSVGDSAHRLSRQAWYDAGRVAATARPLLSGRSSNRASREKGAWRASANLVRQVEPEELKGGNELTIASLNRLRAAYRQQ